MGGMRRGRDSESNNAPNFDHAEPITIIRFPRTHVDLKVEEEGQGGDARVGRGDAQREAVGVGELKYGQEHARSNA